MQVLVITSRDLTKGSTQYRIAQYESMLRAHGIALDYVRRNAINGTALERMRKADLVINQKCLMRASLTRRILAASRRTIFDFDDAIYTRSGRPYGWWTSRRVQRRLQMWLRAADAVTTANTVLADYARRYSRVVTILPMALDLEQWAPAPERPAGPVTIGWIGAPVNLPNLERLEPVLTVVLDRHPGVRLAVYSGQRPRLSCRFDYVPFEPGHDARFVQQLDIGLLPLPRDEFALGKSPIKAIQYLACGVPVVGDCIGATTDILTPANSIAVQSDQEWIDALSALITDEPRRRELGRAGRDAAAKHHDRQIVGTQLLQLLMGSAIG